MFKIYYIHIGITFVVKIITFTVGIRGYYIMGFTESNRNPQFWRSSQLARVGINFNS